LHRRPRRRALIVADGGGLFVFSSPPMFLTIFVGYSTIARMTNTTAKSEAPPPPPAQDGTAPAPDGNEAIIFTDSAARKVRALIEEEGNPDLKLRVFIAGGGCSGFQYGFTFDDTANDDDAALEKMGVVVLVDPMSYQYLVGAEIDYQEKLEGSQFVIRNPNVTSTCGCGSSFAV
jgi:iron-sulfur cluster insertion protein